MAITADQVLELRTRTDEPMANCKRALVLAEGDLAKAEELLRTRSLDRAEKTKEQARMAQLEERVAYLEKLLGIH